MFILNAEFSMISRYERQGLRRGAVVDGRMPAPRTSPLLQKKKNLFLFS